MKQMWEAVTTNFASLKELLSFIWRGKNWWLGPLVLVLALLTFVVVFLEGSALAPFIYVLF
jgi:hypothetical protein